LGRIYRAGLEAGVSAAAGAARFLAEGSTSRYVPRPMPNAQAICPGIQRRNGGDLNDLIDFFAGESI
jgi:hypothetical protein